MKRRNFKRSLLVERLEDRRLLAADFAGVDCTPVETPEAVLCQVAEPEVQSEVLELEVAEIPVDELDSNSTDLPAEADAEIAAEAETGVGTETDADADAGSDSNADAGSETGADSDVETEPEVDAGSEAIVNDLGDPVDGVDGFFGSIDADNPSQLFSITPSEAGVVEIVVASSFGDAEAQLEVTDSSGDVIGETSDQGPAGFQVLSFEAEAGEAYQLAVSSVEGAEGFFQLTTSHSEIPQPTDLHVDSIGAESTQLNFVDGVTDISGELEVAGDVDTFQFTADSTGSVSLGLAELDVENATELQVQVLDADGALITRGITNGTVGISFDVDGGEGYFVAVSAGEGQTGSYQLDLSLDADVVEPDVDPVVDQHADEIGDSATEIVLVDGAASIVGELETGTDADAFQFIAPADGVVALDLTATSADNTADASVTVFDASVAGATGETGDQPLVTGTTNDDVGIVFDVVQGESYQVLVDSLNDVPAFYELTFALTETDSPADAEFADGVEPTDEADTVSEFADGAEVADVDSGDNPSEEELEAYSTDSAEESPVIDSVFAEFDPDSTFTIDNDVAIS